MLRTELQCVVERVGSKHEEMHKEWEALLVSDAALECHVTPGTKRQYCSLA